MSDSAHADADEHADPDQPHADGHAYRAAGADPHTRTDTHSNAHGIFAVDAHPHHPHGEQPVVQLSIVIPAHNEGDDLRRTIQSARADIGDRLRYEVIVVDDASTDGCGENLDLRAGDTLLRHEQQAGVSASKAAGSEAATGDVILLLDGHCKPAPGALPALHRRSQFKLITTDGVFSMDGYVAPLDAICDLADRYGALVHIDDCHATGFLGANGRGTHEYHHVLDRVDLNTGTLGKAVGGASGGYTSGRKEIIDLLRQRSRPYLFSNSVAPPIVGASLAALDLITQSSDLRDRLHENTRFFRNGMAERGFDILPGDHPITPIMIGDAALATEFAGRMLERGIYVVGFSYPVVPKGKARIRTQLSAAHTREDLEYAMEMFTAVKAELGM